MAIEMMLQIRMGHISSPPFWRYSITAHLLVPFAPRRKPGRAAATAIQPERTPMNPNYSEQKETKRTKVTDFFGKWRGELCEPGVAELRPSGSPREARRNSLFSSWPSVWSYFRFAGDAVGATVWPRSFPAPS